MSNPMADKIAALLRKAESTSSPEEAELFTAKAEELMSKYSIEQYMLEEKAGQFADVAAYTFRLSMTEIYAKAIIRNLYYGVSRAFGSTRMFVHPRDTKHYTLVGTERDVELVRQLSLSLQTQCMAQMKAWWATEAQAQGAADLSPADQKVAKRQFIISFSVTATERLKAKHQATVEETTGAELVVVNQTRRVDEYVASTMRVGKARASRSRTSHLGRAAGREAGMRADLGNSLS